MTQTRPLSVGGLLVGCTAVAAFATATTAVALMDWPNLLGRPLPSPTRQFAYGPGALQFADLWLPDGKGPFPVVLMVHGGCWRTRVAKLTIMNYAAEDLRRRGIAVWNLEYRGVDMPGGGYPGTFQDVAAGADKLTEVSGTYHLEASRVVAFGHSAGGHLALWLAARGRLPASSPLKSRMPLHIAAVVSTGGLPDLEVVKALPDGGCGPEVVAKLVGPVGPGRAHVYADTSPAELGAGNDRQVMIDGSDDPISPPALNAAYVTKMRAKGADIRGFTVPQTGHVELIAPGTAAWTKTVETIEGLLKRP